MASDINAFVYTRAHNSAFATMNCTQCATVKVGCIFLPFWFPMIAHHSSILLQTAQYRHRVCNQYEKQSHFMHMTFIRFLASFTVLFTKTGTNPLSTADVGRMFG